MLLEGVDRIGKYKLDIINGITNFYKYVYDDSNNASISDGGLDMYDTGNIVSDLMYLNNSATADLLSPIQVSIAAGHTERKVVKYDTFYG